MADSEEGVKQAGKEGVKEGSDGGVKPCTFKKSLRRGAARKRKMEQSSEGIYHPVLGQLYVVVCVLN